MSFHNLFQQYSFYTRQIPNLNEMYGSNYLKSSLETILAPQIYVLNNNGTNPATATVIRDALLLPDTFHRAAKQTAIGSTGYHMDEFAPLGTFVRASCKVAFFYNKDVILSGAKTFNYIFGSFNSSFVNHTILFNEEQFNDPYDLTGRASSMACEVPSILLNIIIPRERQDMIKWKNAILDESALGQSSINDIIATTGVEKRSFAEKKYYYEIIDQPWWQYPFWASKYSALNWIKILSSSILVRTFLPDQIGELLKKGKNCQTVNFIYQKIHKIEEKTINGLLNTNVSLDKQKYLWQLDENLYQESDSKQAFFASLSFKYLKFNEKLFGEISQGYLFISVVRTANQIATDIATNSLQVSLDIAKDKIPLIVFTSTVFGLVYTYFNQIDNFTATKLSESSDYFESLAPQGVLHELKFMPAQLINYSLEKFDSLSNLYGDLLKFPLKIFDQLIQLFYPNITINGDLTIWDKIADIYSVSVDKNANLDQINQVVALEYGAFSLVNAIGYYGNKFSANLPYKYPVLGVFGIVYLLQKNDLSLNKLFADEIKFIQSFYYPETAPYEADPLLDKEDFNNLRDADQQTCGLNDVCNLEYVTI